MLRSHPGGFSGAGCLGLAVAKIGINYKLKNSITEKISKNPFTAAKTLKFRTIFFENFLKIEIMTKSPVTLGILLYIATMLIFFVAYAFFSGINYFDISLKINAFVLPIIYALAAFWSVKSHWDKHRMGFREAFKRAFTPMFVGGVLSIVSIFSFLNFIDTDAKKLLNYQYVQRQKSELDKEYQSAKKVLKHQKDIDELEQKYQEGLQRFSPDAIKGKDMLTASHFSGYFAAILIFYVVLSVFFGAFFRTKTIHTEQPTQE